ncbi:hypothetical protein VTK56DRAFT_1056 [Thermocarpiscus australiensis]
MQIFKLATMRMVLEASLTKQSLCFTAKTPQLLDAHPTYTYVKYMYTMGRIDTPNLALKIALNMCRLSCSTCYEISRVTCRPSLDEGMKPAVETSAY